MANLPVAVVDHCLMRIIAMPGQAPGVE